MTPNLRKLVSIGSSAIGDERADPMLLAGLLGVPDANALAPLLAGRDGFYAFEGALHIRSLQGNALEPGIVQWNSAALWRQHYGDLAAGCLFFAEDIFGNQFCLRGGSVLTFDAETGALEAFATDMESWAATVLNDYALWTGHGLAHEWQEINGPLQAGLRLVPKLPFVLGGEYVVNNLYAMNAVESMRYRADIALQIHDAPDGTTVMLKAAVG